MQEKAAYDILNCKSGTFGCNAAVCQDCGYGQVHLNSCRNRNCPSCQAVKKELWVDARKSEVVDAPYFHVVFTLPAELNPLIYANQNILYGLMHQCSADTLLSLAGKKKYLGAKPGIIQVLHTWGQALNFHPHIHCIISGGGLTPDGHFVKCGGSFFVPVRVLGKVFRGKFLAALRKLYAGGGLFFTGACSKLRNSYEWAPFCNALYEKEWCPFIKETFNGSGNAIEYLGRYTHRIAISNSRILSVNAGEVSFAANNYRTGAKEIITLSCKEFIRRFMQHVLPAGFQKVRYYGYLGNRTKAQNLKLIFRIQGSQKFKSRYQGHRMDELLKAAFNIDVHICPVCKGSNMRHTGRTFSMRN